MHLTFENMCIFRNEYIHIYIWYLGSNAFYETAISYASWWQLMHFCDWSIEYHHTRAQHDNSTMIDIRVLVVLCMWWTQGILFEQ